MITIQDLMQSTGFEDVKLIAGNSGLDREIKRIGILDCDFFRAGQAAGDGYRTNELLMISFSCFVEPVKQLLDGIKRLVWLRASGLVIRTTNHVEISPDIITYANYRSFPIFVIDDPKLDFEEIVISFHQCREMATSRRYQEKIISRILCGSVAQSAIKSAMLEINHNFNRSYRVSYLKPRTGLGKANLEALVRHGINKELHLCGNALIPYKDGAYFIHSQDPNDETVNPQNIWSRMLELEPERFYVGISTPKDAMCSFRDALMESYYTCFCVEHCDFNNCSFSDLGIYRVLFHSLSRKWLDDYLDRMIHPILDYDAKKNTQLWDMLIIFEKNNGRYGDTARESITHVNTVRNRIKKIGELLNMDLNSYVHQNELLAAVKLFRIQKFISTNGELFPDH